jgi:hypothetical protein
MSTNFYKVFDLLLSMEVAPKRVFVFSDMQFSSAAGNWVTDFERARELYNAAKRQLPQLFFWNLSSHAGAPAVADDTNVALVSGFSSVMMRLLLKEGPPAELPVVQAQQLANPSSNDSISTLSENDGAHEECEDNRDEQKDDYETSTAVDEDVADRIGDEDAADRLEEQEEENISAEQAHEQATDEDANAEDCVKSESAEEEIAGTEAKADVDEIVPERCHNITQCMGVGEQGAAIVQKMNLAKQPADLSALNVLAQALDKPLLRKPRVIHCKEEALELFCGPKQRMNERWATKQQEIVLEEAPEHLAAQDQARQTESTRWTMLSVHLGSLPCKEAVAAFIGRSGRSVRALREELHHALRAELKACKRGVRVWLDVEIEQLPLPLLERGEVKLTAKARVSTLKLQDALEKLPDHVAHAIEQATQRAECKRL